MGYLTGRGAELCIGVVHPRHLPCSVTQAQCGLNATYGALAAPRRHGNTAQRRRLPLLSARI